MKFIILACLIAVAVADKDASVLKSESTVDVNSFNYAYETSNKIAANEAGILKNVGTDNEEIEVTGEFSYVSPEGTPVRVTYRADASGFHPEGDVLPVAPEIPEYIQRAIKLLPVARRR